KDKHEICVRYPPNKKFQWNLRDTPTVAELAQASYPMLCKTLNYPPDAAESPVGLIIPSGALFTAPEFEQLVRNALGAEGFIVEEGPALSVHWGPDNTFVRCVGNACEIARSYIDELLANPADLANNARFVPSISNSV